MYWGFLLPILNESRHEREVEDMMLGREAMNSPCRRSHLNFLVAERRRAIETRARVTQLGSTHNGYCLSSEHILPSPAVSTPHGDAGQVLTLRGTPCGSGVQPWRVPIPKPR